MFKYARRVQRTCGVFPQRGSALIIALVFLLVMTLIGTTAMQGTSQQEKMAGNMRDRNLAFQAAEAALREAVVNVLEVTPTPSIPFQESNDPSVVRDPTDPTIYDWGTARVYSGALTGISAPPRYVVRRLRAVGASSAGSADGVYRVTARAQGGTTDAVVVLQKTFQCTESGTSIQCND
ncbi:MAG: hypothetical protein LM514_04755 [Streptococcus sp.]|jgi:type IV pilus assembly protein PilX|nr:hypothetical protein [Streptococcus sp.]